MHNRIITYRFLINNIIFIHHICNFYVQVRLEMESVVTKEPSKEFGQSWRGIKIQHFVKYVIHVVGV